MHNNSYNNGWELQTTCSRPSAGSKVAGKRKRKSKNINWELLAMSYGLTKTK